MTSERQLPDPYFIRKHCRECAGWTTQEVTITCAENNPRLIEATYVCSRCGNDSIFGWFQPTPQDIIDGN